MLTNQFPDECNWDQVDDGRLGQVLLYVTDDPNQENWRTEYVW